MLPSPPSINQTPGPAILRNCRRRPQRSLVRHFSRRHFLALASRSIALGGTGLVVACQSGLQPHAPTSAPAPAAAPAPPPTTSACHRASCLCGASDIGRAHV